MSLPYLPETPEVKKRMYHLFRDYFDRAEKKRRWNIKNDIPWDKCNKNLNPVIADIVDTFCCVELYLPDYLSKLIPQVRANRGRAWMLANWGYEESKHSMVLSDWLLRSGHRTEEQLADMENEVFSHEWNLPYDNALGMVIYTTYQERATQLHYNNLRKIVAKEDPALDRVLQLVSIDECAHFDFFKKLVGIYLDYDREGTLEQMRRVVETFKMPAVYMLARSQQRIAEVRDMNIFDEAIFVQDVYKPIVEDLKIDRREMRRRFSSREVAAVGAPPTGPR